MKQSRQDNQVLWFRRFCMVWLLIGLLCVTVGCRDTEQSLMKKTDTIAKVSKTPEATAEGIDPQMNSEVDVDAQEESQDTVSQQTKNAKEAEDLLASLSDSEYDLTKALSSVKLKDEFLSYFTVGVAINGNKVENSTTQSPELSAITAYHFNSVTFSNLMKADYLLDQEACQKELSNGKSAKTVKVHFDSVKEGLEFARDNHLGMRGHTLVWHNQVPRWFFTKDYTDDGDLVKRDVMLARMESYIKQVLEYTQKQYPGVIYAWDVVNEAIEVADGYCEKKSGYSIRTSYTDSEGKKVDNLWYQVIGADYAEKAFEFARKYADPEVHLFYNDYNTFEPAKAVYVTKFLKELKLKGLVDGIGMQSYLGTSSPSIGSGDGSIRDEISRYAEMGLEIQVTELTIQAKDESEDGFKQQAERYYEFFKLLLEMDQDNGGIANITNVTFFGLMDHYLFYPKNKENSRLFDKDLQPKPAFDRILDAVDKN